jgi:hypothetical protein
MGRSSIWNAGLGVLTMGIAVHQGPVILTCQRDKEWLVTNDIKAAGDAELDWDDDGLGGEPGMTIISMVFTR